MSEEPETNTEDNGTKYPSWITHTPATAEEPESISFKVGDAIDASREEDYKKLTAIKYKGSFVEIELKNLRSAVKSFLESCIVSKAFSNSGFAYLRFTLDICGTSLYIESAESLCEIGLIRAWEAKHPDSAMATYGLLAFIGHPSHRTSSRQYCMQWADDIIAEISANDLATPAE